MVESTGKRARSPGPVARPEGVDVAASRAAEVQERRQRLSRDPIYRIMHAVPRSDVLEVVKCRFGGAQCARAAEYFDMSYMQHPLRRLRLQIGCDGPTGLHLFIPRIAHHKHTLRVLDLSRNKLTADDVATLCDALGLKAEVTPSMTSSTAGGTDLLVSTSSNSGGGSGPDTPADNDSRLDTSLELLDLSYNVNIGNCGAIYLLRTLRGHRRIRAVQLKCVGIDDDGAYDIAMLLRQRPPSLASATAAEPTLQRYASSTRGLVARRCASFFLNLNENRIGARGTTLLGRGMPDYVSITLCKQRVKAVERTVTQTL